MKRTIFEAKERTPLLKEQLIEVWEKSVKATHSFLSEDEIKDIKVFVRQAIDDTEHLIVVGNESELPVAFMGIEGRTLEMLFVAPQERGNGRGNGWFDPG